VAVGFRVVVQRAVLAAGDADGLCEAGTLFREFDGQRVSAVLICCWGGVWCGGWGFDTDGVAAMAEKDPGLGFVRLCSFWRVLRTDSSALFLSSACCRAACVARSGELCGRLSPRVERSQSSLRRTLFRRACALFNAILW
jgi:hypothetical protein